MAYTVKQLAQLSGISVRTLHFYDEIGLLKPAHYGENGYRYYEEAQLLQLQQILFFRELGLELQQIQKILGRSDFDLIVALSAHRQVLQKDLTRIRKLTHTIDQTIQHLKGVKKMKDFEMYRGFNREKQESYEKKLIERFGEAAKKSIEQSHQNTQNWEKKQWIESQKEWKSLCKKLAAYIEKGSHPNSPEVQEVIRLHYEWIQKFWSPDQNSYIGLGELYMESEWESVFIEYPPHFAHFFSAGMKVFAKENLL